MGRKKKKEKKGKRDGEEKEEGAARQQQQQLQLGGLLPQLQLQQQAAPVPWACMKMA
jgi:hypothetical protein